MKAKILGIFGLLVVLCVFMTIMTSDPWYNVGSSKFLQAGNIQNLLSRTAMFGILGVGVAFVIITGGIDLSIGSLVCMSGVLLAMFLHVEYQPVVSSAVTNVAAESGELTLQRQSSGLNPGDRIRYSGGRRAPSNLLTIASVDGNTIKIVEKLTRDDDQGEIALATPVRTVERFQGDDAEHGARIVLEGQHDLRVRDQLTLVHPESGLKTEAITKVEAGENSTTVYLANNPGKRLDAEWLAIPLKRHQRMPVPLALLSVLLIASTLGLIHGLLVTRARLQPFVVTLCGLLIYRGLSRWLTGDNPAGLGEYSDTLCQVGSGRLTIYTNAAGETFGIPYPFFFLAAIGIVAATFLNRTIWGRYLLALGRNEEAARFSGINTGNVTLAAFVVCSALAAVGGMLFALDSLSISPSSFGNFFELYAIAAAVLGGCSLRGGEGSIVGVVIGTAVMQILNNLIMLLKISGTLEYAIIGSVILVGVLADEVVKRIAAERRLRQRL
ncbi:ABC transporter permease [Fuerstiella marisgermanici]|uniref:Ribose transport system permease protein RbsC n=1 Tax=Fuerstiella marisgermanici TaxID=1891926 RepID=A0A1P8WS32_9PLAN|nr:ABC transporter permease [Fuerstiella marisgermanici]APZ96865.1 Ribose transport system permease protein RbsC [Fuerstiella marisgermanici]